MKNRLPILLIFIFAISCSEKSNPNQEDWLQLFNGKDLSDWDIKIAKHELNDNFGNTFSVEDSLLKVSYAKYDSFNAQYGHIFYKQKFSHYRLKVEYRFTGEQAKGGEGWATRNSGAMLHAQSAASMMKDQDFPISIEAQFLGGLGKGERTTSNLCTPGTHVHFADTLFTPHCISSKSKTYPGDQWVTAEFLVLGDSLIRHSMEGETVLEYSKPEIGGGVVNNFDPEVKVDGRPITEGFIALQSESHPIDFRRVELLNLKGCMNRKAKNYKAYFVEPDLAACQY
jgi:Domain of Unknown Function (DUF1080)